MKPILCVLVLLVMTGCGVTRCRVERVPVTFTDGTVTEWEITICRRWF